MNTEQRVMHSSVWSSPEISYQVREDQHIMKLVPKCFLEAFASLP